MRRGQATPGASLITEPADSALPDDPRATPQPDQATDRDRTGPATAGLLALVAGWRSPSSSLDQVTKALAVAHLTEGQPTGFLGPVLRFDLTRNAGAAFSTATGMTWVLTLIAVAVVVFVVRASRRLR